MRPKVSGYQGHPLNRHFHNNTFLRLDFVYFSGGTTVGYSGNRSDNDSPDMVCESAIFCSRNQVMNSRLHTLAASSSVILIGHPFQYTHLASSV